MINEIADWNASSFNHSLNLARRSKRGGDGSIISSIAGKRVAIDRPSIGALDPVDALLPMFQSKLTKLPSHRG